MKAAHQLAHIREYYFSQKLREVAELRAKGYPVLNLGIGSPDLNPPQAVITALTEALSAPTAHMYQSYQGLPELREAMAKFYEKYFRVSLNAQNEVLPLMGSKEGIFHISKAFLNPGDEVLLPNPGYPTYTSVTYLNHAQPVFYDLKAETGWLPDIKALENSDLSKVKIMWICYPHMPTGAKATKEDLVALVRFTQNHDILLVNDNPYSFILNKDWVSIFQVENAFKNSLELNSLSKTFNMAGWRIGMVAGRKELLQEVIKVKSNLDSGMFYGLQKGAVAALQTDTEWLNDLNEIYDHRRQKVWKMAERLGCTFDTDTAGLFVWAKLPKEIDALALVDELLYKHHLFVTPGHIFGSNGNAYIRISLCVNDEILDEATKRLENFQITAL